MDCNKVRELILTYAGSRETAAEEVHEHLKSCAGCRRQWEQVAGVWDLLGEHPTLEPSAHFLARLRRRIFQGSPWRVLIPIGVAAAAILAIVFSLPGDDPAKPGPGSGPDIPVVRLSTEDQEVLDNLELLENYELIQALEAVDEDIDPLFDEEEGGD